MNTLVALWAAVHNPPVLRLKQTWGRISEEKRQVLLKCAAIVYPLLTHSGPGGKMKGLYESLKAPCVPFMGASKPPSLHTRRLPNFNADPYVLPGVSLMLFRFSARTSEGVIRDFQNWQRTPYDLERDAYLDKFLREGLERFKDCESEGSVTVFMNWSFECEPYVKERRKMSVGSRLRDWFVRNW